MKVAAIVPIKSTSERIPEKNTRLVCGEPMYHYIITTLLSCEQIDRVYVDSENRQLLEFISKRYGCYTLERERRYASNETDGHVLLFQAAKKVKEDIVLQTFVTAPLLSAQTIDNAVSEFKKGDKSSLIGISRSTSYTWKELGEGKFEPNYDVDRIPNSTELKPHIIETMSLYINYRSQVLKTMKRYQIDSVNLFDIPDQECLDINYSHDLKSLEEILLARRVKKVTELRHVASQLSTPLICDTLDDLHIDYKVHTGFIRYKGQGMGISFVKTMKIVSRDDDNHGDIYQCLKSYNYVGHGDMLIVETAFPELAYFGDLNSSLLLKTGADGIMVDGVTRDIATIAPGISLFAKGVSPKDVKFFGWYGGMNNTVNFDGELVSTSKVVFYDELGVIFVDIKNLEKVLSHALFKSKNESDLRVALLHYEKSVEDLLGDYGNF